VRTCVDTPPPPRLPTPPLTLGAARCQRVSQVVGPTIAVITAQSWHRAHHAVVVLVAASLAHGLAHDVQRAAGRVATQLAHQRWHLGVEVRREREVLLHVGRQHRVHHDLPQRLAYLRALGRGGLEQRLIFARARARVCVCVRVLCMHAHARVSRQTRMCVGAGKKQRRNRAPVPQALCPSHFCRAGRDVRPSSLMLTLTFLPAGVYATHVTLHNAPALPAPKSWWSSATPRSKYTCALLALMGCADVTGTPQAETNTQTHTCKLSRAHLVAGTGKCSALLVAQQQLECRGRVVVLHGRAVIVEQSQGIQGLHQKIIIHACGAADGPGGAQPYTLFACQSMQTGA